MTITVYGAGAIGGITGARLAQAGHDVLLVDKAADHVAAMNAHGLTIDTRGGSVTIPVRAVTPEALGSGLELVLLAVKSQDTPAALEVLAPRLAPTGAIVSLQNGLNEELIAKAVGPERTVGCLVNWGADWQAPGRILHGSEGALVLGELDGRRSERVQQLAKLLDVVSPTRVSDNILGYTWAKHVYGALLVATALVDAHVYDVVERSPEIQAMLVKLTI
jgi:2-dehydropantoate 2-reductase